MACALVVDRANVGVVEIQRVSEYAIEKRS